VYIDQQAELSVAQAVTANAISSNVIDLRGLVLGGGSQVGAQDSDSQGPVYLVVRTAALGADTSSDATLQINLETSASADLSASTVLFGSKTFTFAEHSPAGTTLLAVPLPPSANWKRYVGLRYTVGALAGTLTLDAFITTSLQRSTRIYASGFKVQ
jgi:hypothetical protein